MAAQRVNEKHKAFLLNQVARFEGSAAELARRLNDPVLGKLHGFEPIRVAKTTVQRHVAKITKAELSKERTKFLMTFENTPLAHTKMRVLELAEMIEELDELMKTLKADGAPVRELLAVYAQKQGLLRDLRAEGGEDIDKMAKAIRESGGPTVSVSLELKRQESRKRGLEQLGLIASDS